jgi:hypothetical protein
MSNVMNQIKLCDSLIWSLYKNLNKFCITIENKKDIEFINSFYKWQPPNDYIISYLFDINKLVQKHNESVFINTLSYVYFQSNGHQPLIMSLILETFKWFE